MSVSEMSHTLVLTLYRIRERDPWLIPVQEAIQSSGLAEIAGGERRRFTQCDQKRKHAADHCEDNGGNLASYGGHNL